MELSITTICWSCGKIRDDEGREVGDFKNLFCGMFEY